MKILKYFLLVLTVAIFSGCSSSANQQKSKNYYLLIGSYTKNSDAGIYVYKFDTNDGSLKPVSKTDSVQNPSYLAVSADNKYVYAVNENRKGSVSAFSFNNETGTLTFINKQSSNGGGPCYLDIDQTGNYIVTANYGSGSFTEFAINDDGSLKPAAITVQHHGSSVNKKRQSSPHAHCSIFTPDNKYVLVNDLGTDYVSQYAFDASTGKLTQKPVHQYKVTPGQGPRHITFTPNGKYAYLVTEMGVSVIAFKYADGELHKIQELSAKPKTFQGHTTGSEVHVSKDGKFLYVSLRQDLNKIAIYSINQQSGKLTLVGYQSTKGEQPRFFMIDPTGQYVIVSNLKSNNVVVFKRDKSTGKLTPTGTEIKISMPVNLRMIPVE